MNSITHPLSPCLAVQRDCFVCGTSNGIFFLNEEWDVLGLGVIQKGFRCCSECGLILQDPVVSPKTMSYYYKNFSNYTNQSRKGLPTKRKIQAVEDQIYFLKKHIQKIGSAFQIGCSDGYTLSRFKKNGWQVYGCEPSAIALTVAKELWDINGSCSEFETYIIEEKDNYDIVILTHVLEHLYNPIEVLKRIDLILNKDGLLLIEVPLFTNEELLPEGYFTFEHINYFSHTSLKNTVEAAGFEIVGEVEDDYETDIYPIQRLVAQRGAKSTREPIKEVNWAKSVINNYVKNEMNIWNDFSSKINEFIPKMKDYVIWASGIHTSQLLCRCKLNKMPIAIVDTDIQKWGLKIKGIQVISPDEYFKEYKDTKVVISSQASEVEIYNNLVKKGILETQIKLLYQK